MSHRQADETRSRRQPDCHGCAGRQPGHQIVAFEEKAGACVRGVDRFEQRAACLKGAVDARIEQEGAFGRVAAGFGSAAVLKTVGPGGAREFREPREQLPAAADVKKIAVGHEIHVKRQRPHGPVKGAHAADVGRVPAAFRHQTREITRLIVTRRDRHGQLLVQVQRRTGSREELCQQAFRRMTRTGLPSSRLFPSPSRGGQQPRAACGVKAQQAGVHRHMSEGIHRAEGGRLRLRGFLQEIEDRHAFGALRIGAEGGRHVHAVA